MPPRSRIPADANSICPSNRRCQRFRDTGDQKAKLLQFLNKIGARALRIQLGRVLETAESSPDKAAYERKIVERFGGQQEFQFVIPGPSPEPASNEAAN
jgi:hypothetical protein